MSEYLFAGIMCILGCIAAFAACTGADWFFSSKNAAFFVRIFGYRGARIFYFVLGIALCVIAYIAAFIR